MIADLIELAHARDLVRGTWLEPDACDAYRLRALPRPITVWVRPDGRFSRAMADDELLTLGQVMRGLLAFVEHDAANPQRRSRSFFDPVGTESGGAARPSC